MGSQLSKPSSDDSNVESRKNGDEKFEWSSSQSVVQSDPDNLFSPPSIRKPHSQKSFSNCNSPICNAENRELNMSDVNSYQLSRSPPVLRDITNTCHSSDHCLTGKSQVVERNVQKQKQRVPFSNQNIDALYSVFYERSLSKKRKRYENDIMFTPPSVTKVQHRSSFLDFDQYVDQNCAAYGSCKSGLTNNSGKSQVLERNVQKQKQRVPFSNQNIDALYYVFSESSLSKKRKSTLFEVPITVINDISAVESRRKQRKERRLEHEVEIQFVPQILYESQNTVGDSFPIKKNSLDQQVRGNEEHVRVASSDNGIETLWEIPETIQPLDRGFASASVTGIRSLTLPQGNDNCGPVNANCQAALVLTANQIRSRGLFEIQQQLSRAGKTLSDFPNMPIPDCDPSACIPNTLIAEQLDFNTELLENEFITLHQSMTNEQKVAFDQIIQAVQSKQGICEMKMHYLSHARVARMQDTKELRVPTTMVYNIVDNLEFEEQSYF
ncbi:hypothetical protein RIF29_27469 [Crotalaria pallida]|uniref:Uncharacterized protein n=1 Tax=Crotalaria pallida TaxID=3830 RepID=A0AAN9EP49_CROPI